MKKYLLVVWLFMVGTALSQISHTFTFNASDITTTTDNEKFTHVTGQAFNGSIEQVGAPELPVLTERFVLPSGSKVTGISVNNSGEILLDGNAHIYPTQPAIEFDSISEFVPIDSSIYNSNHPFPKETSILRNDAYTMGYHVVTVEICPFQ